MELTAHLVRELHTALTSGELPENPAGLAELVASLEELKSGACGMQAEATAAFDAVRRREQAAAGVPAARQGRGIAHEIALARKESPHRGQTHLGFAKVARPELPHTLARLKDGTLSEFRAHLIVRETACLEVEQRRLVDEELCADPATLAGTGTRELIGRVKRMAAELDPAALVKRARRAEADRHVTLRPAPDTMTYLTALLPVAQGVAVYAALERDATSLRASGAEQGKGQLMADLLVARVAGLDLAKDGAPPAVPVAVTITMSDAALAGGHDPANLGADGVVPEVIPAEVARLLTSRALDEGVGAWFRQLYTNPLGRLVGLTSKQRLFTDGLASFLSQQGQGICASAYCDAPVRHIDHIEPAEQGGATSSDNGQGLCEACNHAKQAPGWSQQPANHPRERHRVVTITPTGHRYVAAAPPPIGWREPRYVETRPGLYLLVA